MTTAGILLAAGRSTRFGDEDKLLAPVAGKPLVTHAADALRGCGFDHLLVVTDNAVVARVLPGFEAVSPGPGPEGMSQSLATGLRRAGELGADRAVIVLADMPCVTSALISGVAARCTPENPSATTDGTRRMPPACFPAALFGELTRLRGAHGARELLASLPAKAIVTADPDRLMDVDTRDDLERAEALITPQA